MIIIDTNTTAYKNAMKEFTKTVGWKLQLQVEAGVISRAQYHEKFQEMVEGKLLYETSNRVKGIEFADEEYATLFLLKWS